MASIRLLFAILASSLSLLPSLFSQTDTIEFSPVSEYPYPAPYACYTAHFDRLHRPYIYTANQEYGLIIFDFSNSQDLKPLKSFILADFQGLRPTDLVQEGDYLYVALGGFAGPFPQKAGLAILDISNPANATILGQWSNSAFNKGCAAVRVQGDYAYLGAMEKGVVILNISNPAVPKYVSHLELELGWPAPPGLFNVPHARGLVLRGDELWTCFDAGGLRLVNIFNKQNPFEAYKYIHEDLDAFAQPAYNTATIVGKYLYVAVDYCGIDIVDISKPTEPVNAGWENTWNCDNSNWPGRPGHTNQLATACQNSLLFASGGDTEVIAWSIANPTKPRRLGQHAVLQDSVVTWGIDVNDSLVVLAQIWNPLNLPYIAKYGGIRLLRWNCPQSSAVQAKEMPELALTISPNPAGDQLRVQFDLATAGELQWRLVDMYGRTVRRGSPGLLPAGEQVLDLDLGGLPAGVYAFVVQVDSLLVSKALIKD